MTKRKPIQLNPQQTNEDTTFKGCCTSVFRVIRSGVATIEDIPESIRSVADDISDAWEASAEPIQSKPRPTRNQ